MKYVWLFSSSNEIQRDQMPSMQLIQPDKYPLSTGFWELSQVPEATRPDETRPGSSECCKAGKTFSGIKAVAEALLSPAGINS